MARVFLAGAEPIELLNTLVDSGCTNVLLSFFYIQKRGALPKILKILKQHPEVRVFIDSGARTFTKEDRGDPQPYWRAYYDLLREHGHRFEYATEFDADSYAWKSKGGKRHVSDEQIEVWREDLTDLKSVVIVPVWHPERGMGAWDALIKSPAHSHLAISDAEFTRGELAKIIGQAHAWKKTVHGFGQAAVDNLRYLKFDTVSCSNWLYGQRFGDAYIFEGGHLRRLYASGKKGKAERKKFKRYFERIGVNPEALEGEDRQELNKANAIAWVNFGKRLEVIHGHKGPTRPTVPVGTTNGPKAEETTAQAYQGATTGRVDLLPALGGTPANKMIPLQPVDSITVEKTETQGITLQRQKKFMPNGSPMLMCAGCNLAVDCPKFNELNVCAFQEEFSNVGAQDVNSVVEELASIFAVNVERGRYLRLAEQITGGGSVDPGVTKHMTETFQMGAKLAELMKGKKGQKATVSGQGALDRFFGKLGAPAVTQLTAAEDEEPETDGEEDDAPAPRVLNARQERAQRLEHAE